MNFIEIDDKLINLHYVCAIKGDSISKKTHIYFVGGGIVIDMEISLVKDAIKKKTGFNF